MKKTLTSIIISFIFCLTLQSQSATATDVSLSEITPTATIDYGDLNLYNSLSIQSIPTSPNTIYVSQRGIAFGGLDSAPSYMYYQTQAYSRLYRGIIGLDRNVPIQWHPINSIGFYSGRLYRDDLPYPTALVSKDLDSFLEEGLTVIEEYSVSPMSQTKEVTVRLVIKAKDSNLIPAYYNYDDGQYRGVIPLIEWHDNSQQPGVNSYIAYYRGTVNRGAGPIG